MRSRGSPVLTTVAVAGLTSAVLSIAVAPAARAATAPAAVRATVSVLPELPGADGSEAKLINASGQVAGNSYFPLPPVGTLIESRTGATRWSGGRATDISGGLYRSEVTAQNDNGLVVGSGVTSATDPAAEPYVWRNGRAIKVTLPGEPSSVGGEAVAVNNRGQVVVNFDDGASGIWTNGTAAARITAGTVATINNQGEIGGNRTNPDGTSTGFVISGGRTTYLPTPAGWTSSTVVDVNDRGQVVGDASRVVGTDPDASYAQDETVLWDHGAVAQITAPADVDPRTSMGPISINNRGEILGSSSFSVTTGYVWQNGTLTVLPAADGIPIALNNAGQVLLNGRSGTQNEPFLYQNGTATPLPDGNDGTIDAYDAFAYTINDRGQIAGIGYYADPTTTDEPRRAQVWTVTTP